MTHPISTCIWFDGKAKEAALFYQSVFQGDFKPLSENPLAVNYSIAGRRFMHLNGGPGFPINPSISFFIGSKSKEEINDLWEKLSNEGMILMALNTYPWSEWYGWCQDKYGVNWQLMMEHESAHKIMPHLMFVQKNNGKAKAAIDFYTSIFKPSSVIAVSRYEKGEPDTEGNIKYSQFSLNNLPFGAMDSSAPHQFTFNEGVSFIIMVDTQEEIDYYWEKFSEAGHPGKCGWIKDQFGVSWQIIPSMLGKLMNNPETAPKAMYAFMQMTKMIIADLTPAQ
jgi:hypothetical protein